MEKKIEDYLKYYIGSDIKVQYGYEGSTRIGQLVGRDERFGWQVWDARRVMVPHHFVRTELLKPILRPLSDMTEEEMLHVAGLEGYFLDTTMPDPDDESKEVPLRNAILQADFFPKGIPYPQDIFGTIEEDCIGFLTKSFLGTKDGIGEVWSEPQWDTFWNWSSTLTAQTWHYLLSRGFDLFGLIDAGLAIEHPSLTSKTD